MKLLIDRPNGVFYIYVQDGDTITNSEALSDEVTVDYNEEGELVGIEVWGDAEVVYAED